MKLDRKIEKQILKNASDWEEIDSRYFYDYPVKDACYQFMVRCKCNCRVYKYYCIYKGRYREDVLEDMELSPGFIESVKEIIKEKGKI